MKPAHSLKIVGVTPQGTGAVLVSFAPDATQAPHFEFEPGQYLTLAADVGGSEQWRCYSITSAPIGGEPISVLVRRVDGGSVSNWICDQARPGHYIKVLPPAGHFTLATPEQPVLLFAGGSGIAPIFALAQTALAKGAPRVSLFYANRDRPSAMLIAELDTLQQQSGGRLDVRYWYDAEEGLPSQSTLKSQASGMEGREVYLCGPEPFMRAVSSSLAEAGFAPGCVHREEFTVNDDLEAEGDDFESSLSVRIKGQTHTVVVKRHASLLSAMLQAGLPVPHACKVGECASCVCHLEAGEVERLENSVLDEDDVRSGWLVACRTRARSDTVSIRFD